MVTVALSPGEWIHLSWVGHRRMVWKGYRPRVRLVLAGGHASAWFSPFWRGPAPGAQRYQAVSNLVQIEQEQATAKEEDSVQVASAAPTESCTDPATEGSQN